MKERAYVSGLEAANALARKGLLGSTKQHPVLFRSHWRQRRQCCDINDRRDDDDDGAGQRWHRTFHAGGVDGEFLRCTRRTRTLYTRAPSVLYSLHIFDLSPFILHPQNPQHPSPFTFNFTTLHSSPFTRHPSPVTLHPSPVTLHSSSPAPTLHPSLFTLTLRWRGAGDSYPRRRAASRCWYAPSPLLPVALHPHGTDLPVGL